jgi:hypothetical protein
MAVRLTMRLDYDDNGLDIIDKVNSALQLYGLEFKDDDQEHDGFCIFELIQIPETRNPQRNDIKDV